MKQKLLTFLMSILLIGGVYAQEKIVKGKVTSSEDGEGLPGVTIMVPGTNTGTQTDGDGNYSINVPSGYNSLEFKYIGFSSQLVTVGDKTLINIALLSDAQQLSDVVVTALGVKREKKSLGYATQEVSGSALTQSNETNVLNSLSGKVAGVQITGASGAVGASSRIVLRGNNSFGNNQPLFVVDGVPIDNSATGLGANGSTDYGSGAQELDPNNIASVNVLKGANAAALYGARAANGVIMITTKSGEGEKGLGITYSGGFSFENIAILPKYQNKYGQGGAGSEYWYKASGSTLSYNDWAVKNSFSYFDGMGNGINDDTDESWGPRLDIGLLIPQYNSPRDANGNLIPTPWISHPNNTRDFFTTGYTIDNNIAFTSNTEKGSTRFSYTNLKQTGTIPNTDQKRNTVQLSTSQKLTDKFTTNALINYVRTDNSNLTGQGYNSFNPMNSLGSWFGRQVDIKDLKKHSGETMANGAPYNWISQYHDNPYETVNDIFNQSRTKDRLFGYLSASYDFNPWISALFRVGNDLSYENRQETTSERQIDLFLEGKNGQFIQREYYKNELNLDFILTGNGYLSDEFSLNYTAGANFRDYKQKYTMIYAQDLVVPGIYNISNVNGNPQANNRFDHIRSNSLFAQTSLGFKEQLFLDVTARNDWSSTLPSNNRSYFYPSASLSWIFTESLNLHDSFLSFGKLRGGWAKVGNATSAYQTLATYLAVSPAFGGVPMFRLDPKLPPLNLKPESITSTEIGLELGAFRNRLRFDATWYNKTTTNQIMEISLSRFTGASSLLINAGEIENKGVEIHLGGTILQGNEDGFSWDIDANWALNRNKVNKLYTDPVSGQKLDNYPITSAWGVNISAVPGESFGVIRGSAYKRDDNGNVVVNSNGMPTFIGQQEIGNITPDWVGGITNTFNYKNFSLSFLIDVRKGGDFYSVTDMFSTYTGVLKHTAAGDIRENGLIVGRDVLKGYNVVKADGTPNDIVVSADQFFTGISYAGGGTEYSIIDGSYIKLRNINFTYRLPNSITSRYNWLKGAGVSVFANNLALLYTHKSNKARIDPETGFGVGNDGLGIEQYQIPSNRSIGLKLNVAF